MDIGVCVGDGDVALSVATMLEEFRGTDTPRGVVESSREKIVVVRTALQLAFGVVVWFR